MDRLPAEEVKWHHDKENAEKPDTLRREKKKIKSTPIRL